jgi:hypothetical protein
MKLSKFNPVNWFRRGTKKGTPPISPSPPSNPLASGTPKYRIGQRCLILFSPGEPRLVGQEAILEEAYDRCQRSYNGEKLGVWSWRLDKSPMSCLTSTPCRVLYRESWLLPIDDESLNEELRNEEIREKSELIQAGFGSMLDRLDKLIDQFERDKKNKQAL